MIEDQIRDYAQRNKIAADKIELVRSTVPDLKKGLTFNVECRFTKYSLIQKLGSRFSAKCEYDINYLHDNLIVDDNPWGNTYRVVEKQMLPLAKPVFETRFKEVKIKSEKRNAFMLSRFNKMLRLYTTHDELEEKKNAIKVAQQQLDSMQSAIENQTFDYVIAKQQYDEKMHALREKFKTIKNNLIQETRQLKQKNFNKLAKVNRDCKVAAKTAIESKKRFIQEGLSRIEAQASVDYYLQLSATKIKDLLYKARNNQIIFKQIYKACEPDRLIITYDKIMQDGSRRNFEESILLKGDDIKKYQHFGLNEHSKINSFFNEYYNEIMSRINYAKKYAANNCRKQLEQSEERNNRQCYDSESEDDD
jgi:hypothetical protein